MKDLKERRRFCIEKLKSVRLVAEILNFVGADKNLRYSYYAAERDLIDEVFLIDKMITEMKENFQEGFIEGYGKNNIKKLDCEGLVKLNETIEKSFNNTYGLDENGERYNNCFESRREALIEKSVDEIVKLALSLVSEYNKSIL